MKTFKENEKRLLARQKEVKYLGDLISMETKVSNFFIFFYLDLFKRLMCL
jgi:hypothetical protein